MTMTIATEGGAGGVVRVVPAGELDLANRDQLREAIDAAVGGGATAVVVDLVGVDFIDSSTIAVLVEGRALAERRGLSYQVVGATGMVAGVLEIAGLDRYLAGGSA